METKTNNRSPSENGMGRRCKKDGREKKAGSYVLRVWEEKRKTWRARYKHKEPVRINSREHC